MSEHDRHPERPRVLFLVPSLACGGAERVVVTLLRHLDRRRFEPHLALVHPGGLFRDDVPGDIPVHDLNASQVRYCIPALLRLFWRLRPAIALSTLGHLNLALLMVRRLLPPGTRLLVREGTNVTAVLGCVRTPGVWRRLYRSYYRRAARVICQSDSMMNDMAVSLDLPRSQIVRIYNPIDVERIEALAGSGTNPYPDAGPHLVAAGRMEREKRLDLLIDAVGILRQRCGVQLTILGSGSLESPLRAKCDELGLAGCVHFAGARANPYPYLKHANLLVLSSAFEGMPNVVLEALALGTPVVAAECIGGLEEIAKNSTGLTLVKPDADCLADGIAAALSSGRRAAALRLDVFAVSQVVAAYEQLFDDSLGLNERRPAYAT